MEVFSHLEASFFGNKKIHWKSQILDQHKLSVTRGLVDGLFLKVALFEALKKGGSLKGILYLVGAFNPFEKYDRQIGSFPQVGVKIKNIWNHHLVYSLSHLLKVVAPPDLYLLGTFLEKGNGQETSEGNQLQIRLSEK